MASSSTKSTLDSAILQEVDKVRHFPGAFYVHDTVRDQIVHMSERIEDYLGFQFSEVQALEEGGRSLVHPEDLAHVAEMNRAVPDLDDGQYVEATYRMRHKDGNWKWLHSQEYVFSRDEDGKPIASIGLVQDVTLLKTREIQLAKMADYNSFLVATSRLVTEGSGDIRATLQELAHMISIQFDVVCNIFFLEESDMSIRPGAVYYSDKEIVRILDNLFSKYTVKLGEGMVGQVIENGSEFILHEVEEDIRKRTIAVDPKLEPVGLAYLPIKGNTKIIGAINLTRLVEFPPLSLDEWERIAQVVRNVSLFVEHSLTTNNRKIELDRLEVAEAQLRDANTGNEFLLQVSQLAADLDKKQDIVLKNLAKSLSGHFNVVCDVHIVDEDQILQPVAWYHAKKSVRDKVGKQFDRARFKVGYGMMGNVAETGQEHLVRSIPESVKANFTIDPEIIPDAFIYLPLVGVSKVVGILGLSRLKDQGEFSESELGRIRNAANTISEFFEKRQLHDSRTQELELRKVAESDLKELNLHNEFLLNLSNQVSDLSSEMAEVLQGVTNSVMDHFGVACSVHLVDQIHDKVKPLAVSHEDRMVGKKIRNFFEQHYFDADYSMLGKVVQDGEEFLIKKVGKKDLKWFDSDDPDLIPSSLLFLPIVGRSQVLGILDITKSEKGDLIEEADAVYLREVAKIIALFIENHLLFTKHKRELGKRKKVEELLRSQNDRIMRSEKELRGILDTIPILVARVDKDLTYRFVNNSYRAIGVDPASLIGKDIREVMGEELFEEVRPKLEKAMKGEVLSYSVNGAMKDGTQRSLDVVVGPDIDSLGNISGFLSCAIDVTDRARAEMDLVLSEERLRIIFDNVEDVVCTFNEEGRLESVNRTAQGLTKEDVIGSHVLDYYSDPEREKIVQANLNTLIMEGKPFTMDTNFIGLDGSSKWYSNRYAAVFENNKFTKGIIITRDITGQKEEEKAIMAGMLQGQEVERKRLAAEMHDGVGQILAAISIELSQLAHRNEVVRSDEIGSVSSKVQSAISEVRIISHALKPDVLENFGLVPAIQEVVDSASTPIGPDLSFNHIDVQRRFNENIEINIYRSLQELITNCLKHANAKDIFITLILDEGKLILTVEDDGLGFKEKDPTGIGINNVKSRIALIGGSVTIDSSEGKGSLINIEVPIEDE